MKKWSMWSVEIKTKLYLSCKSSFACQQFFPVSQVRYSNIYSGGVSSLTLSLNEDAFLFGSANGVVSYYWKKLR